MSTAQLSFRGLMSPSGQLESRSAADPYKLRPQTARLETRRIFLEQSSGSLEYGPWSDKMIKNTEQFKNQYKRHREGIVENA
jgi:hypothetical protein